MQPVKVPSPADINTLMVIANFHANTGNFADLYATTLSSEGVYVLKFTGTATDINTTFAGETWRKKYAKYFKKYKDRNKETNLLLFLRDEMQVNGISLFKVKNNGNVFEIKLNDSGKRAVSEKCSD